MFKKAIFCMAIFGAVIANGGETSGMFNMFIRHCIENSGENIFDPDMQGSEFNWKFEGKYKVIYADKTFFSYLTEELSYTGGAHGNFKVSAGSLYRNSGRRITLKDIAPTSCLKKKLLQCVTAGVAKHFKCSVAEFSGKLLKKPFLTENFYLDARGITFIFNEYEIACKGAGAVKISVPFEQYKIRLP